MGDTAAVRLTVLREQNSLTGKFRPDERCNDFLTVSSLVSQKLSHPFTRKRTARRKDPEHLSFSRKKKKKKKKECYDMCRDLFKREKINGCSAVWDQSNRGCYAYTDDRLFRGNNHDRHACWIPEIFQTPDTEDFYSEPGYCLDGKGNDQNQGVFQIASGNYFSSEPQQQAGLDICRNAARKTEITGCEVSTSGVYMHTKEVQSAKPHNSHQCFIAKGPVSMKK